MPQSMKAFFRKLFGEPGPRDPHREIVKRALEEGKPVPPEVLKDYPDLAKMAPPKPKMALPGVPREPKVEVPKVGERRPMEVEDKEKMVLSLSGVPLYHRSWGTERVIRGEPPPHVKRAVERTIQRIRKELAEEVPKPPMKVPKPMEAVSKAGCLLYTSPSPRD